MSRCKQTHSFFELISKKKRKKGQRNSRKIRKLFLQNYRPIILSATAAKIYSSSIRPSNAWTRELESSRILVITEGRARAKLITLESREREKGRKERGQKRSEGCATRAIKSARSSRANANNRAVIAVLFRLEVILSLSLPNSDQRTAFDSISFLSFLSQEHSNFIENSNKLLKTRIFNHEFSTILILEFILVED